jgi:hypothetical protein
MKKFATSILPCRLHASDAVFFADCISAASPSAMPLLDGMAV